MNQERLNSMILAAAHTEQLDSINLDLNLLLESLPFSLTHVGKCMAFHRTLNPCVSLIVSVQALPTVAYLGGR